MIRFSVIIPLYNKANFVRQTVDSVLNQTYTDFEIIIVNDGSTDNSLAVVNEINDSRIRIFSKENGGVSVARNFGIEKSQNEYIAFLDADDLWLPGFLETIKEMIKQSPQAGIFAMGCTVIDNSGRSEIVSRRLAKGETLLIENYSKSLIKNEIPFTLTGTICIKKSLFDKTGVFREGIKRGEDLDMWLRLSLVSPIMWKNESKTIYNKVSENNAMSDYSSYKDEFPYWEWYAYGPSIYLKFYANLQIRGLLKHANYRDRICILSKINWFYLFIHFLYYVCKKIKGTLKK